MIKQKAIIKKKELLAPDIYSMTFDTGLCSKAAPGQFVLVYPPNGAKLLGRPLCIAETGRSDGTDTLRIVFRAGGSGTGEIAACKEGTELYIEGPLGRGYPMEAAKDARNIVLIGGGIGAPSLLFLARALTGQASGGSQKQSVAENAVPKAGSSSNITAVLGYRDSSLNSFLASDMEKTGIKVVTATDDGSLGVHGNVIDAMKTEGIRADLIYACGPMPMLSAIKKYAKEQGIAAYISLEEHMACGVGVCLGCVTNTTKEDPHSHVKKARICTEGPVFDAEDVDI